MKKVFFMAMAVAALTFTSCNSNKDAKTAEGTDTTAVASDSTAIPEDAEAIAAQLTEKLNANDNAGVTQLLAGAQAKIAELYAKNPEIAKEYFKKVQDWVSANKDAVAKIPGSEKIIEAITSASADKLDGFVSSLTGISTDAAKAVGDAAADVNAAANGAEDAVKNAGAKLEEKANEAVNNAKEAANAKADEAVNNAKEKINNAASDAAGKVTKGLGL